MTSAVSKSSGLTDAGWAQSRAARVPLTAILSALAVVMPFFMWIGRDGTIYGHGPSIAKLLGTDDLRGRGFTHFFQFDRPQHVSFENAEGYSRDVVIRLRDQSGISLRGTLTPVGMKRDQHGGTANQMRCDEQGAGNLSPGWLMNISCGAAMPQLLRQGVLTAEDFAATDMAVDLLYLTEAKSAAMAASLRLNRRLQGAKTQAEILASTDTLTGLNNRRVLDETLMRLCRSQIPFALMHMDLDHFKRVNDSLGHGAGDHVLQQVAQILRRELRSGDTIIRNGGDEFVLILEGMGSHHALATIAKRLVELIAQPIDYQGHLCQISASLGIARSEDYAVATPAQILRDADTALYASKAAGRACFRFFETGRLDADASQGQIG